MSAADSATTTVAIYNPRFKFAMFGCWNQLLDYNEDTDKIIKNDNVKKVITTLRSETGLSFIVIAGDNYYPIKIKTETEKMSIIDTESLKAGFNLLPSDVPIYLMYGNHDLDNSPALKIQVKTPGLQGSAYRSPKQCLILNKEEEMVKEPERKLERPGPNKLVMFKKIESTIIIMIDTSMYSMPIDDPTLECYKQLLRNGSITPETIMEKQMSEVREFLDSLIEPNVSIKNVIVVGHDPLLYVKPKKDKETKKIITKADPLHVKAFDLMFAISEKIGPDKQYFYLCADLHNYQKGKLEITKPGGSLTIQQYVVGTGGTGLDDAIATGVNITSIQLSNSPYFYEYKVEDSIKTTGYLICEKELNKDVLKFEFKQVPPAGAAAAGGKKTRRRKKVKKTKRRKPKRTPLRITR